MEAKIYNSLKPIKSYFNDIFFHNSESIFQSYDIISVLTKKRYFLKGHSSFRCIVIFDESNAVAIFPLRISKHGSASIVGSDNGMDIVNNIMIECTDDYAINVFSCFFSYIRLIGIKELKWFFLPRKSVTYKTLFQLNSSHIISIKQNDDIPNVNIGFNERGINYDSYFHSLTKSNRQNIRTAYNRMASAKQSFSFEIFSNDLFSNKISHSEYSKNLNLYIKRQSSKYKKSLIHKLGIRVYNYVTLTKAVPFSFISVLKINNKQAAFMEGYTDLKNRTICIPRLAINDKFKFFSPGIVLTNETIKKLFECKKIDSLNLVRGEEKYKLDLGGEIYFTQKMIICLWFFFFLLLLYDVKVLKIYVCLKRIWLFGKDF